MNAIQIAIIEGRWEDAEAAAGQMDAAIGEGDFHGLYVAGARAMAAGRCTESEAIATLLLSARPDFVPARELIILCQLQQGNQAGAQAELGAMLATLPEGPERDVFEQMLRGREAANGPSVSINAGVRPSSNINRQTSATDIFGFPLPDANRAQRGVELTGGVAVTQELLSADLFQLSGVLRADLSWSSAEELLRPSFTVETPMTFTRGALQVAVTPFVTLGLTEGERDLTRVGARMASSYALAPQWSLGVGGGVHRSTYALDPRRDATVFDGTLSLSHVLSPQTRLTALVSGRDTRTDIVSARTQEISLALRVDHLWDNGLITGLQGGIGRKDYNRPATWLDTENQQDQYWSAKLDLSHRDVMFSPFDGASVRPSVFYEFTDQRSDSVFHTYQSHDVGFSLRLAF